LPRNPAFDNVVFAVAQLTRTATVCIVLASEGTYQVRAMVGPADLSLRRAIPLIRHVLKTGEVILIEDVLGDGRFHAGPEAGEPSYRFCVLTPLTGPGNEIAGCLCILDGSPRTLSERQLTNVRMLARQASDLVRLYAADQPIILA